MTRRPPPPELVQRFAEAVSLHQQGRLAAAAARYQAVLADDPDNFAALHNLGIVRTRLGDPAAALGLIDRAIAREPASAEAQNSRGNALAALRRYEEAAAAFKRAVALKPELAQAHNNLGNALVALGRLGEALEAYDRAIALRPDYADAQFSSGIVHLTLGNFEIGWRRAEWRRRKPDAEPPPLAEPPWLGEQDLAGKTILLRAEQGLGDTIQFARYVPRVAQRAARVLLEVQPPLVSLLRGIEGAAAVFGQGEPLPHFDVHAMLMSLPLAFGTRPDTILADVPYLAPSPEHLAKWRPLLPRDGRRRLGLAWAGNPKHKNDRRRSMPLALLEPLLALAGVTFVVLQRELREGDAGLLERVPSLVLPGERLLDMSDTAALVQMVDLVITVDTAIAHLSGALARPVWVMLPHAPDWRWLLDRADSPWYPTARLFRQPVPDDWPSVVNAVMGALRRFLATPC
jgi:tetratricopeptide (TPR) repeat protein